ncbi:hypothetical protein OG897_18865 [Streptomyces sp. NBC_00237]|uniref:hypothetical protein n=1 Tax=Streptomyces sp. NBC_00237 TaxID=2975687 RepID=UPI00225B5D91|nr:hypothetical protein [Streptomyces sp. NBC_00237]MCX5203502.1 hypothetical protein [Streptomyces sp. NBC_00237]
MLITEDVLHRAWRELAARCDLLDESMLPKTTTEPDYYEEHEEELAEALLLVVDPDGTVRGVDGSFGESFATRDLGRALYFAAEYAVRTLVERQASGPRGPGLVAVRAELMDRIAPAWGQWFREGGPDGPKPLEPCTCDPLEGFAWAAGPWRDQAPYTELNFYRGEGIDAARLALRLGADPEQVARGMRLAELRTLTGKETCPWDAAQGWETFCFGQAGDWAFVFQHDTPPRTRPDPEPWPHCTESVHLSACMGKAIYTFAHQRDGRPVDDGLDMALEVSWYEPGQALFRHAGELDFLNRALRRAELDHPELGSHQLFFHALEASLGLRLPRRDFQEGTVLAAQWARDPA